MRLRLLQLSFSAVEELPALPKIPYLDLRCHLEAGEREGNIEGREGEMNGIEGTEENTPGNKFLATALRCCHRRSQDFFWGYTFLANKIDDLF